MLTLKNLWYLKQHNTYLSWILDTQEIFLVGGCIRDLLLNITQDPKDVDFTMHIDPDIARENMNFDEKTLSRFRTEKFGTMTFIPKIDDKKNLSWEKTIYELTPFRTEWGYSDNRHPDEITRSDNIIDDSKRRDFSINCVYRYGVEDMEMDEITYHGQEENDVSKALKSHKNILDQGSNTLILQDTKSIQEIFEWGYLQREKLITLLEDYKLCLVSTTKNEAGNEEDTEKQNTIWHLAYLHILVDPHSWLLDMLRWKIKTVGNPDDRFTEDALRIIRWVRFANTLNQHNNNLWFDFDKQTRISMKEHAWLVEHLAGERIHDEIKKVFSAANPFGYVSLLQELTLLPIIFPALAKTINSAQPTRHHSLDTYHHILMALKEWQAIFKSKLWSWNTSNKHEYYLPLLAILYHDVGKPEQYAKMWEAIAANPEKPDRSTYEYHTETGAKIAQEEFKTLAFSKREIEEIMWYIRWHHRPWEILDGKQEKRPVRMRKLMSDGGYEWTHNLLDIVISDRRWQHNPLQSPDVESIETLREILDELYKNEWRFTLASMNLSGDDILSELHINPWPEVWEYLTRAFDRVIGDVQERNEKDKIIKYLQE